LFSSKISQRLHDQAIANLTGEKKNHPQNANTKCTFP